MSILVGKKAPEFTAKAVIKDRVVENFSLSSLRGQYVILFLSPRFHICLSYRASRLSRETI